jgi:hypothetical protein
MDADLMRPPAFGHEGVPAQAKVSGREFQAAPVAATEVIPSATFGEKRNVLRYTCQRASLGNGETPLGCALITALFEYENYRFSVEVL